MSEQEEKLDGPDFAQGVPFGNLAEGSMIVGHVAGEAVVLARTGGALFAIGAECTHYHGPLAEGMLVADTIRCPWHHACFSLRTGEALRAPALNPVARWRVEQQDRPWRWPTHYDRPRRDEGPSDWIGARTLASGAEVTVTLASSG